MSLVLVLRPQPGADATAQRLREAGLEPIIYPLFEIGPMTWQARERESYDALMVTSANAVRWAGDALETFSELPAFAVGQATAAALSERGFRHIEVGKVDVQALVRVIDSAGYKNILHLCGDHVRSVDPGSLSIHPMPVYRTTDAGNAKELLGLVRDGPIILIHSPRAGARLAQLLPVSRRKNLQIVTISRAAADACGLGWAGVSVCERPSDAAMLAIVRRICEI